MPEEFGTKDVLEQVDSRLANVEQDVRAQRNETREEFAAARTEMREEFSAVRTEIRSGFAAVRTEMQSGFAAVRTEMREVSATHSADTNSLRQELRQFKGEVATRLDSNTRWIVGMMFASWISVMASFWLKP